MNQTINYIDIKSCYCFDVLFSAPGLFIFCTIMLARCFVPDKLKYWYTR